MVEHGNGVLPADRRRARPAPRRSASHRRLPGTAAFLYSFVMLLLRLLSRVVSLKLKLIVFIINISFLCIVCLLLPGAAAGAAGRADLQDSLFDNTWMALPV